MASRNSRIMSLLNYRLKIILQDGRYMIGQMIAFDRFMNLVLQETQEFRTVKDKTGKTYREEKRALGLVILRGETIVSMSVEAPPSKVAERVKLVQQGIGVAKVAGRGMPIGILSNNFKLLPQVLQALFLESEVLPSNRWPQVAEDYLCLLQVAECPCQECLCLRQVSDPCLPLEQDQGKLFYF